MIIRAGNVKTHFYRFELKVAVSLQVAVLLQSHNTVQPPLSKLAAQGQANMLR